MNRATITGGLAQLARAPALQAGGQRFESVILHSLVVVGVDVIVIVDIAYSVIDMLEQKRKLSRFLTHSRK